MTEQEAIKWQEAFRKTYNGMPEEADEACDMAMSALEEIQRYRALGTVQELERMKENGAFIGLEFFQVAARFEKLKEYQALGTPEELREEREKQVPKKPKFYAYNFYCSKCGNLVGNKEFEWQRFMYCDHCGQAIDWSN